MLETNHAVLRENGMTAYRVRELIQFVGGLEMEREVRRRARLFIHDPHSCERGCGVRESAAVHALPANEAIVLWGSADEVMGRSVVCPLCGEGSGPGTELLLRLVGDLCGT